MPVFGTGLTRSQGAQTVLSGIADVFTTLVFAGMSVEDCFDCWLIQEEPGRVGDTILWWPGIPEQDKQTRREELASKEGCFLFFCS